MKLPSTREALASYDHREHALIKHTLLGAYLERCLMIVGRRWSKIAYIDGFAGPWKSARADLSDTSSGVAIRTIASCVETLRAVHHASVRVRSVFIEADHDSALKLQAHAKTVPDSVPRPLVWEKTFEDAVHDVARWLEPDEFAFVFVDPFGWKGLIEPAVLAPLLRRPHTELLINFMWNFVNLATGHAEQTRNLDAVFGTGWKDATASGGEAKRLELMSRYRQQLSQHGSGRNHTRLRTAMLPVEYVDQKKVVFYLVYATHSPTGLVVFREEAERVAHTQERLKLQHRLDTIAEASGQADLFSADVHAPSARPPTADLHALWLDQLPAIGQERVIDYASMAELIEQTECPLSELQAALAELIDAGVIENLDAKKRRPKHPVNYKQKERLRRLK